MITAEGSCQAGGRAFSWHTESPKTVGTTELPMLSLRDANGDVRTIIADSLSVGVTTADNVIFRVRFGSLLVGDAFLQKWAQSRAEIDESASSFSGGFVIFSMFASNRTREGFALLPGLKLPGLDMGGLSGIYTVTAQSVAGNASVLAGLNWRELA